MEWSGFECVEMDGRGTKSCCADALNDVQVSSPTPRDILSVYALSALLKS